jgi:hypothetical protein
MNAPAAGGWLALGTSVFLASAAGWLRACHRAVSAGSGLPSGSRRLLAESAGGVAACVPGEMSRHKSTSDCDWQTLRRSASFFALASNARPSGHWRCCGLCWLATVVVGSHSTQNFVDSTQSFLVVMLLLLWHVRDDGNNLVLPFLISFTLVLFSRAFHLFQHHHPPPPHSSPTSV